MSLPDYIISMFKGKKSGKKPLASAKPDLATVRAQDAEFTREMDSGRADSYTPAQPTSARDTPEARANLDRRFNAMLSEMGPGYDEPAPVKAPESRSSAIQRGISGVLGFVPKGGTQGDAADGFANIGRTLMGFDSVQKMESDYNKSIAPEKLRRALETGDVEAIKRLDPGTAAQVQGVDDTTYTGGRQRKLDEAIAAGDIDAMRRLDPTKADEREVARREAAMRASNAARVIGGEDPAKVAAVINSFANEQPNLFSPQQLQALQQGGPDALEAMLGAEGEDALMNLGGGTLYDRSTGEFKTPPPRPLTDMDKAELAYKNAQIANIYSDIANRGRADEDTLGTPEQKSDFTGSLNSIADTAVRLANAGAIGVDGKGARTPIKSAIVGAKTKEGGQTFLGSVAQLMGDETAQIFSSRETQVDFAIRQFAAAAGIKSGSLNSNFELQNVKNALGNPFAPMEDQIAAADAMSLTYGDGTRTADYLLQSGQITQKQYDTILRRTVGFEGNIQRGVAQERANPSGGGSNQDVVSFDDFMNEE